jgi:RNA polymerase sigma-70 factor (ECF subfamily)
MNPTTPAVPPATAGAPSAAVADFDGFYRAHYPGLVAMAYALLGDPAEAQDVVQEAFCRAWRRLGHDHRVRAPGRVGCAGSR